VLCDQNAETFSVKDGGAFSNAGYLRSSGILSSVNWYHSTLRKIPEEGRSYIHRGGSLKSHLVINVFKELCS
jgi:hypothetical protein